MVRVLAPLVLAGLCLLAVVLAHAHVLAAGTRLLGAAWPRAKPPLAVTVEGTRLRVVTGDEPEARRVAFVDALALGWNLPVLVALLGWLAPQRLRLGSAAVLLLLALQVVVAEVAVREITGEARGALGGLRHLWQTALAPLLPVLLAAAVWATAGPRGRVPQVQRPASR